MPTTVQMSVRDIKTAEQFLQFFGGKEVVQQAFFPSVQRHEGVRFDLLPGFSLVFQSGHSDEKHPAGLDDAGDFIGNPFDGGVIAVINDLDGD